MLILNCKLLLAVLLQRVLLLSNANAQATSHFATSQSHRDTEFKMPPQ